MGQVPPVASPTPFLIFTLPLLPFSFLPSSCSLSHFYPSPWPQLVFIHPFNATVGSDEHFANVIIYLTVEVSLQSPDSNNILLCLGLKGCSSNILVYYLRHLSKLVMSIGLSMLPDISPAFLCQPASFYEEEKVTLIHTWTEVRRFTSVFQMAAGNFPGHLKTAETRICRHSDHRGKKWQAWLAPWWQVAFRRKNATSVSFVFVLVPFLLTHPSLAVLCLTSPSWLVLVGAPMCHKEELAVDLWLGRSPDTVAPWGNG